MFCQSKKKKKDEEKGVYCPIAQKTIQPPKTGNFLVYSSKSKENRRPIRTIKEEQFHSVLNFLKLHII